MINDLPPFYRIFSVIGLLAVTGVVAHASSPSTPVQEVVGGNTAFAVDLYGKLQTNSGNIIFSPSSISTALAMTYAGARGNTEVEMAKTLHFTLPQESLHPAFAALEENLKKVQKKGQVALAEANSLWPQSGYPFLPSFLSICQKDYETTIQPVNFAGNPEEARKTINNWVGDKTHQKILDLLQPGILDQLTRLVLVNAIYFKGNWAIPFDASLTKDEPFHLTTSESVTTPLMHQTHEFGYAESPDLQVLELPYSGNDLSMLVLLPSKVDGLEALEGALTPKMLSQWRDKLRPIQVNVSLPKFKVASEFSLNETLQSMGMIDAFGGNVDFSGMDGKKNLYIKAAVHKAFVEVNEKGTEAAAATAVVINLRSAIEVPLPPPIFRADHPFLFLIRENNTGSILFLGRVTNPSK